MVDKHLIENILNIKNFDPKENLVSTLTIALRGARRLTGRNSDTGLLLKEEERLELICQNIETDHYYSNQLLGITNYLIILDLIGCVFSRKDETKMSKDGIEHALLNFSKLNNEDLKAIKALRNSLAHNFGLGNDAHVFSLSDKYSDMIKTPNKEDAYYLTKTKEERSYTNVNPNKLFDFIESIYIMLHQLLEVDKLELKKGVDEDVIRAKFTIK